MSFGYAPFGLAPFGAPVGLTTDRIPVVPPRAAFFDPETREYPFDTDGNVVGVHPVDQEVAHRIGVAIRSFAASSGLGVDLWRVRTATNAQLDAIFADTIQTALGTLIAAGDVTLLGTPRAPGAGSRALFFVDYVNNRDTDSKPRRLSIAGS